MLTMVLAPKTENQMLIRSQGESDATVLVKNVGRGEAHIDPGIVNLKPGMVVALSMKKSDITVSSPDGTTLELEI
jgi:hypothetical protein